MARWGEGDPRWIVEERPDATNPHNWHWTEKNATPWSRERLEQLLRAVAVSRGPLSVSVSDVPKLTGEATANNRKAKLIFLYEWDIELRWLGRVAGSTEKYEGRFDVPNLSDENSADELDVSVRLDDACTGEHADALAALARTDGAEAVRRQLAVYIRELKEEFSRGLVLPTPSTGGKQAACKSLVNNVVDKKSFQNQVVEAPTQALKDMHVAKSSDLRKLTVTETFKVPPQKLYDVFTEPDLVRAWTNGPCKLDAQPGGEFILFGGKVSGRFTELEAPRRLEMHWRLDSYPAGHFAHVKMRFKDEGDATELVVSARDVPVMQADETEQGLKRHYMSNIMRTFGFGTRLI